MKQVVIVGGGFAGSLIAKSLEQEFKVTLIDTKDYFEFTPGVLRTIVSPSHLKKIQILHNHYLHHAKIIKGIVTAVDKNHVYMKKIKIPFDYCVIASGSSYDTLIKDVNVIAVNRAKKLREYHKKLHEAKKVVIIGGGLVGVELAAEIATHYKDKEITILEQKERIMTRQSESASRYAQAFLEKNNVVIHCHEHVKEYKNARIKTEKGRIIDGCLIFLCTGIKPNSSFMKTYFSKNINAKGFIQVNQYLQLREHENIFVAGDVADVKEEKLAQNAEYHAEIIAHNIQNLEEKKPLKTYTSKKRIMVISLGKYDGILTYGNFVLKGIIPGIMKSMIEWMFMRKYK
jgi:NADH dehydrogenase FAD-containing subunit